MKKHYILVSVEKPNLSNFDKEQAWLGFQEQTKGIDPKGAAGKRLGEAHWLLLRDNDVPMLAQIVYYADRLGLAHKTKFLTEGD